ncbi:hypothetical protein RclHR1_06260011 [Rhizophagus clarus]|uniref:RRM domain-containing protein n=1 Tax=Rhizophagus clarus TaxID=94130 RepID=A0A2Z6S3Q7_9GLOM|nr:hypothetical protein RclHR1_06260011 [Rhizophagus clarus]
MDEDVVADTAADTGVEVLTSSPKENNTAFTSLFSHLNIAAALSAPNDNASGGLDASMHARTMTSASPLNAIDFQAAAAPNSAPETLKNFTTNKALIDAVNNTFLEMYDSYTGKARMTGSGDAKRLVIHFQTKEARDACVGAAHQQFPDLVFYAHDPKQLQSDEDLRAIQVTDIPFFLTKDNIMSYFKKFGNIASCRVYSRKNAKVQQARIVYDSALSIAHFDTQWAVYCFSTYLRVTPCHYTVDQKSSHCEFIAALTQLPPNTKDIDLAPLTRDLSAKAGRTRRRNPVSALKERFNINQPARPKERSRSGSRLRSRLKGSGNSQSSQPQKPLANTQIINNPHQNRSKSNDKCDRSVSFSTVLRTPPPLLTPDQAIFTSPHEAANILSLLKSLQQDMAEVRDRITALELNDRHMTRIE